MKHIETSCSDAPRQALRDKGRERLKKLTDSATELFLARGYEAASMDTLIQQVGGSRRNIYSFFGGKEGLFAAVVSEECKKLAAPLESLVLSDGSIRPTLEKFGHELLRVIKQSRTLELHRLMIAEGKRFPHLSRAIWFAGHHNAKQILATWIKRQQEQGKLCGGLDASALSYAFIHIVTAETQMQMLTGGEATTEEQDKNTVSMGIMLFLAAATIKDIDND